MFAECCKFVVGREALYLDSGTWERAYSSTIATAFPVSLSSLPAPVWHSASQQATTAKSWRELETRNEAFNIIATKAFYF